MRRPAAGFNTLELLISTAALVWIVVGAILLCRFTSLSTLWAVGVAGLSWFVIFVVVALVWILIDRLRADPRQESLARLRGQDEHTLQVAFEAVARNREWPEMINVATVLLETNPDHPQALHGMGTALMQMGRTDSAEGYAARLLEESPSGVSWALKGDVAAAEGKYDTALECYARGVAITPDSLVASVRLRVLRHFTDAAKSNLVFAALGWDIGSLQTMEVTAPALTEEVMHDLAAQVGKIDAALEEVCGAGLAFFIPPDLLEQWLEALKSPKLEQRDEFHAMCEAFCAEMSAALKEIFPTGAAGCYSFAQVLATVCLMSIGALTFAEDRERFGKAGEIISKGLRELATDMAAEPAFSRAHPGMGSAIEAFAAVAGKPFDEAKARELVSITRRFHDLFSGPGIGRGCPSRP
jgi:tetratricopeptide (TPR) repeat protein